VGLGHRGGVLRGFIQDPASGLPRIYLLGTPVNKDGEGRGVVVVARPSPLPFPFSVRDIFYQQL
jgi:hypothetical protein